MKPLFLNSKISYLRISCALLSFAFLFLFYHSILLNTSAYIFDTDGDGLRGWYISYYQIHDTTGGANFMGMNYPYVENIEYIDPQPVLTELFRWINFNVVPIDNEFMAVSFLLILFMLPITALILLEILFFYNIRSWIAVLFAISIAFMNPQFQRICSHATLAYSIFIPLSWLLLIRFQESGRKRFLASIFLMLALVGFLNANYTVAIALTLFLLIVFNNRLKKSLLVSIVFLPVLFYSFLVKLIYNSANSDLNPLPYGAFGQDYRCRPEDLFFPVDRIWNEFLNLKWIAHSSWEGYAFIGWALWIPFVWVIISFGKKFFIKRNSSFSQWKTNEDGLLLSVILLLIFTAGLLYFILPKQVKLAFPAFITNFRTFGRLAWIVFYFLSVYLCIKASKLLRILDLTQQAGLKKILSTAIIILICIDVFDSNIRIGKRLESKTWANLDNSIQELASQIDFKNYQAIIALPYFHGQSGVKGERSPIAGLMWPAFYLSVKSHLPLTDHCSSRTSQKNARTQLGFYQNGKLPNAAYFPNKKPFLIVTSSIGKEQLAKQSGNIATSLFERKIFLKARPVCSNKNFFVSSIAYSDLAEK